MTPGRSIHAHSPNRPEKACARLCNAAVVPCKGLNQVSSYPQRAPALNAIRLIKVAASRNSAMIAVWMVDIAATNPTSP